MKIKFQKFIPYAKTPSKFYPTDSCFDLFAAEGGNIAPYETKTFTTGIGLELPYGFEGQVRGRSGLASQGIFVHPGTVDCHYRGEIKIIVFNSTDEYITIKRGYKLAQIAIAPVTYVDIEEVDTLEQTDRGVNGLGSTGKY